MKKLTYLADYDDLSVMNDDEKVVWMKNRINLIFVNPINKIIKEKTPDFPLGVMTVICLAIESLGHFSQGSTDRRSSEKDFKIFIKNYIPSAMQIRDHLYKYFRSGLAHAFAIERGSIDHKVKGLYRKQIRGKSFQYEVHPWRLFKNFEKGINAYFIDLEDKKRVLLRNKFIKRFNFVYSFWIKYPPRKIK